MKTLKVALSFIALPGVFAQAGDINVDGVLDEEIWQQAQVIENFVTTSPYSLVAPDYPTEVRMHTSDEGIYIGIKNKQPEQTQISQRSARDATIDADANNIIIDFDNTGVAAYRFSIGNGGSMQDGIYRDENDFSSEWDGIWYAKTTQDADHWFTEVLIPWDVAPMVQPSGETRHLGLHVERQVVSLQKTFASQPINPSRQRFLSDIQPVAIDDYSGASVQTFASLTARKDRVRDDSSFDASLDLFWKPDSSKQLSLTNNPDFGHVDSDNLVVNFSPTETFFSENRAFFTENQSLFSLSGPENLTLVHTRRIGGQPDTGTASEADIKGAVKFTSINDDFSYGVFSALEDGDDKSDGRKFHAGRVMHKNHKYHVGYLATYTQRPDIDRDALVQAIDYGYFFSDDITLKGQVLHSGIKANGLDTRGSATWFELGQQFSDNWEHSLVTAWYDDEFEVNDLGFLPRNDLTSVTYKNTLKNHDFSETSLFQEHKMSGRVYYQENGDGMRLRSALQFLDAWYLKDSSWGQWSFTYEGKAHDDLITRGNQVLDLEPGMELDLLYFGDARSSLRYHLHATAYDRTVNGKGVMLHAHPSYYFTDNYVLTLGLWYTYADDWLIWQGGNELNSYKRKEFTSRIDFNATLDAKQELTVRFQWIALSAKGKKAYEVNADGGLTQLNHLVDDFSISDTAIQIRYRYEIAPLSNLYLVYSRGGRATLDDDQNLSSLFSPGWDKRDGDNLSLKVRYQF